MSININELSTAKLDFNYWQDIIKNIKHNLDQIIDNKHMSKILKYDIDIEFVFDDLGSEEKFGPNACAKYIDTENNKYQIVLGRKLLTVLRHFSFKVIDYDDIFPKIPRTEINREKLSKLSDTIFYLWVDFICLHEWFHIVRGHLNYGHENLNKNFQIDEFSKNKYFDDNEINLYLEIDADRFAGKVLTGRFSLMQESLAVMLNLNEEDMVEGFSIFMIYLFDLFFLLSDNSRGKVHPSPSERMVFLIAAMQEAIHTNPKLFNLTEEKFLSLTETALKKHYKKHEEEYILNAKDILITMKTLDTYTKIIKDIKLNDYQILKEL